MQLNDSMQYMIDVRVHAINADKFFILLQVVSHSLEVLNVHKNLITNYHHIYLYMY